MSIIVRTTLQDLENRAGVGVSGGGTVIPISEVIRMASHANHYLAVFDKATGSALDLFRARRVASAAQRIMLIARDGGCTKPGCTVPAYGTQVHHAARDWADGGQTNIDELGLACPPDNRMVEPGGWSTRMNEETDVEWIPPDISTPGKPASTTTTDPNDSSDHPMRNLINPTNPVGRNFTNPAGQNPTRRDAYVTGSLPGSSPLGRRGRRPTRR